MTRPMTALRACGVAIPSNPKPIRSESGVVIVAPTGKPEASVRVQLLAFGPLPAGGPVICQPSRPASNDVVAPPGQRHVVDEDAEVLDGPVVRVGDRDLDGPPPTG